MPLLAAAACWALLVSPGAAAPQGTAKLCAECHAAEAAEFKSHPHFSAGLSCGSCHGESLKHARSKGTVPPDRTPGRQAIPRACGQCHAAELKSYKTSRHAELLFGRAQVAAPDCTTCHGAHKLHNAEQIENRCLECHSASFMAPPSKGQVSCLHCHSAHSSE